eukprot:CCRYP_017122-RA/>CCRYP_017122-RA protein AED:0.66 eAED:0.39 QI:0/-1/0/1/-1/1/1/0/134
MKVYHQLCRAIVQLDPRNSITINNAVSLEDNDVLHQRSDLVINRDVDSINLRQTSNHNNCTKEFWLRACKLKMDLQQKCREYEIQFIENETKDHLAQKLASKFFQDSLNNMPADVSPVTEEELSFEAKQVAFLQ